MPTTGAWVKVDDGGFDEATPDILNIQFTFKFNGPSPNGVGAASFPRNTTNMGVKQSAVRDSINGILQATEPGVSLTNANIQICGMPI
jgi:hypothetical protein